MSIKNYMNEYYNSLENEEYAQKYIENQKSKEKKFYIALGHGSTMQNTFIPPNGVNIIFLTDIGESLYAGDNSVFFPIIRKIYLSGNTLFKNKDNSYEESEYGSELQSTLRKASGTARYNFVNFIGDGRSKIMDSHINFYGGGCNSHKYSCSLIKGIIGHKQNGTIITPRLISHLNRKKYNERFNLDLISRPEEFKNMNNTTTLSKLIDSYGKGSYIILTCRNNPQQEISKYAYLPPHKRSKGQEKHIRKKTVGGRKQKNKKFSS